MKASRNLYHSIPLSPQDDEFTSERGSSNLSTKNTTETVMDLYDFMVEATEEDAQVLKDLKEKVKEQGRLWWSLEATKGAGWYLQPEISSVSRANLVPPLSIATVTNSILLKKLIRKGIPPRLRPKLWMAVSGAAKKRSTVPESYFEDLFQAASGRITAATRQIDHDLPRTFPSHPWLASPEGHAALRRVLLVYSFRDSHVGYCQGMNFVAGLLLLVMKTEEEAFWMLAVLLENVLFQDCYTNDLAGCHVEQRVFKDLLNTKCARLAAHLEMIGFDVSLVITEWFLCLFSKSLPSETTMRIWDVLFNEGAKILFRVALAIFKMKEDELLATQQIGEVINIFQHASRHLFDPDALLKVAFEKLGSMTMHTIAKHRTKQQVVVMEELEQRVRRLKTSPSLQQSIDH